MSFKNVPVEVDLNHPAADWLLAEFDKLEEIYAEHGENHRYTMVAQVFACKSGPPTFFLSGRMLTPDESAAFAEILEKAKRKDG